MMTDSTNKFTVISKGGETLSFVGKKTVIALGTFDGVHTAHRQLLCRAVEFGRELGAGLCGAFCFYESPLGILRGTDVPLVCPFEEKIGLMLDTGLDFVAVAHFSDVCDQSAEHFIDGILQNELGCVGAVCGFNHRFGKNGKGDAKLLCNVLGEDRVITYPEVKIDGETVSSSSIRKYLANGNITLANRMLGRPFSLEAPVLTGKKLGRTIGCPTTNQVFPLHTVELKHGIYATLCTTSDGKVYVGASNVGIRPSIDGTIDDHSLNCETLISDFSRDVYGEMLKVEFYEYLRGERRFDSLYELSAAIRHDLDSAVCYFKENGIIK